MLANCLDLLNPQFQTLSAGEYEVIVTDDGNLSNAESMINENYPWVRWVSGPKRGPAANRNNGERYAQGDWLIFIDDDCLPERQLLEAYQSGNADHPNCRAFEGAIYPDDWELYRKDMAECPINTEGGAFWSANIMIERKLFQSLGGFDEQFRIAANEDQDLYERIQPQTAVCFLPEAKVIHPVRFVSLRRRIKNIPRDTRNWHHYYRKNHGFWASIGKAIHSQFMAMLSCVKYLRVKSFMYHVVSIVIVVPILLLEELTS